MTYQRIEDPRDLPPPGPPDARAREKADLDFKGFADRRHCSEHAKDIAAFANALGGVLLIGADDNSGRLLYPGVRLRPDGSGQSVADVKAIYEAAAKMCSPTPVVDVVAMDQAPGVTVVAVNVDPYVDQAVAAPTTGGTPGWVFPIRRASLTEPLTPETLAMHMNREIRRAVIMLSNISSEARCNVTVHYHLRARNPATNAAELSVEPIPLRLEDVCVDRNRVRFVGLGSNNPQVNVPLLDVLDVWESRDGNWDVLVAGEIQSERMLLSYRRHPR